MPFTYTHAVVTRFRDAQRPLAVVVVPEPLSAKVPIAFIEVAASLSGAIGTSLKLMATDTPETGSTCTLPPVETHETDRPIRLSGPARAQKDRRQSHATHHDGDFSIPACRGKAGARRGLRHFAAACGFCIDLV
ncbi:MAG TPA: hypothetical protein VFF06_34850 [Polyangia bacterium]|nr:hypothetical protein [Polyangia bacterium]